MTVPSLAIRVATLDDAPTLAAIYAPYVEDSAVSFEYEAPSAEEFRGRMEGILQSYPYLVAEWNGRICGYAYAGTFKPRKAYEHSAETTIYLREDAQGLGIGKMLYRALENVLLAQNVLNLYACIATTPRADDAYLTDGSPRFHEHMGYVTQGEYTECAYKFDAWYDMIWMGKKQGVHSQGADAPADFVPFSEMDAGKVRKLINAALRGESEDERRVRDSAGAVVFRETEQGSQVLMIQMKNARRSFPKGHIEEGETREACAVREIAEETGVACRILPDFCYTVPSVRPGDRRSVYFLLAVATAETPLECAVQDEEIDDALWVSADEAADMVSFEDDKTMYLAALAAYRARA